MTGVAAKIISRLIRDWMHPVSIVLLASYLAFVPARTCMSTDGPSVLPAEAEGDLTELSLEELMDIEIDEVYGASRYRQKISDAPSSISIITSDEIRMYGYRNLADILAATRSFYATYDRLYQYLGVRGFLLEGDYNSRVLIMIDGHRMNDAVYGAGAIGNELPLDVDLIDRVEVIRGPSFSIYGDNAFFAVINIVTRDGNAFGGPEAAVAAGSHDTYKGRISYGDRFTSGPDMLFSGSYFSSQGHTDLYFKEFDNPATNGGHVRYVDDETYFNVFGKMSWLGFTLQGAYGKREKTDPTGAFNTQFNNPRSRIVDKQGFVELRYDHAIPLNGRLTAKTYYDQYYYDGDFFYDWNDGVPPPDLVLNKDIGRAEMWGAELHLVLTPLEKHKIALGAKYRDRFHQEQSNYDEGVMSYFRDDRDCVNWGVYLQDEYYILDNLSVTAGVGYDHFDTFGGTTNPRAALIFSPFETTTLKLLYGTAFRGPTAYEMYYHDGYNTAKPNPDLDEEKLTAYEAVLEQKFGSNLYGSVSGYFNRIEDLLVQTIDPADDLLQYVNLDDVEVSGVEMELGGKLDGWLEGRASYSYQVTEVGSTGKLLPNSPKHLAKLNLIVPLIDERLFSGLEVQYRGRRTTFKNSYAEEFTVANLTLLGREIIKGLEVSATVYNIFNDKHGDPVGDEFMQSTIEQDGTSFRLKVTYRFK